MQIALTIAGFDPSSGAGVTADLMVFAAHRLFGTSCITSLTVQSTLGVQATHPVAATTVRATLDCLHADLPAAGIKIGMLSTAENVAAIAEFLASLRKSETINHRIPIVLDSVMRSSSGRELLESTGVTLLRDRLLPLVDWVTPNLDELSILTGLPVASKDDMLAAALALHAAHPALTILATGGHLKPPDDLLLTPDGDARWLPGTHIPTTSTHGTGCALSSALLSRLIQGGEPYDATLAAKNYVAQALRTATPIGGGRGPIHHLWPLDKQ
jgi:hydroxymethylpyrimidine/phosphomethylpyrimidine kinase